MIDWLVNWEKSELSINCFWNYILDLAFFNIQCFSESISISSESRKVHRMAYPLFKIDTIGKVLFMQCRLREILAKNAYKMFTSQYISTILYIVLTYFVMLLDRFVFPQPHTAVSVDILNEHQTTKKYRDGWCADKKRLYAMFLKDQSHLLFIVLCITEQQKTTLLKGVYCLWCTCTFVHLIRQYANMHSCKGTVLN